MDGLRLRINGVVSTCAGLSISCLEKQISIFGGQEASLKSTGPKTFELWKLDRSTRLSKNTNQQAAKKLA
jgi:hypothetical protein